MGELSQDVLRRIARECAAASSTPVMIEVGAAHPEFLSVSFYFRQQGWRIIAVEPNPRFCELHEAKGYPVLQYACGESDQDDVPFSIVDSHGEAYGGGAVSDESFSSLSIKDNYRALKPDLDVHEIRVRLRRLDTILRDHAPEVKHVDTLSIDVEGWEMEVLNGFSLSEYKPQFIIIENLFNSRAYRARLNELGYFVWKCEPPNEIYVRKASVSWLKWPLLWLYSLLKIRYRRTP